MVANNAGGNQQKEGKKLESDMNPPEFSTCQAPRSAVAPATALCFPSGRQELHPASLPRPRTVTPAEHQTAAPLPFAAALQRCTQNLAAYSTLLWR